MVEEEEEVGLLLRRPEDTEDRDVRTRVLQAVIAAELTLRYLAPKCVLGRQSSVSSAAGSGAPSRCLTDALSAAG